MIQAANRPWLRIVLAAIGIGLLGVALVVLRPERWLGTVFATNPASAAFNRSLVTEMRIMAGLLGAGCLLLAGWGRQLPGLGERAADVLASGNRWLLHRHRWPIILLAMTASAAAIFAAYSITRHAHFNSKAYDLGLHAQVFWNTSQGRLFGSSVEVGNYLGDHVSPIILLLTPLYWLWPDPRALLVLQAAALASGALPLAWLARRRLQNQWPDAAHASALLLALLFLLYPALGFVNRFEFHEEVLAVPLLLLAFLFLETGRPWLMSAALFLALLCKEDVGLTVAAFGLFAWWRRRHWRWIGLGWFLAGLTWSLTALLVVIPAFRAGVQSDTLSRYAWLGEDAGSIVLTVIRQPGRVLRHLLGDPRRPWFLVKFLLPLGFLPVLSPAALLILPVLLTNWLAANLYQSSIYFHYAVLMIPVLFAATVYGLERAAAGRRSPAAQAEVEGQRQKDTRLALALLWLVLCATLGLAFDQFWQAQTGPTDWENYGLARQIDDTGFAEAAALLPADGSVATTEAYASHLANREGLYLLPDPRILQVADEVDWVLVNLTDHRYGIGAKMHYALLRWIADRRGLEPCYFVDDVVLLGPACASQPAADQYRQRLSALQAEVAEEPLAPEIVDLLGARFFQP